MSVALLTALRRSIRWYVNGIRVETYGYSEEVRRAGRDAGWASPDVEEYIVRQSRGPLAWADFLDALAGRRRES